MPATVDEFDDLTSFTVPAGFVKITQKASDAFANVAGKKLFLIKLPAEVQLQDLNGKNIDISVLEGSSETAPEPAALTDRLSIVQQSASNASPLFPIVADKEGTLFLSDSKPTILSIEKFITVPSPSKDVVAPHIVHRPNVPQPDKKFMAYRNIPFGMSNVVPAHEKPAVRQSIKVKEESTISADVEVTKETKKRKSTSEKDASPSKKSKKE